MMDGWLALATLLDRYCEERAKFIEASQYGENPNPSRLECVYVEAGKVIFDMLDAPPYPSVDELTAWRKRPSPPKEKSRPKKGFIYLMRNKRNGMTKIGWSINPEFREKTLQSEEPEIEMIAKFPGSLEAEGELHTLFIDQRVRGEWFNLSEEQITEVILNRSGAVTPARTASE